MRHHIVAALCFVIGLSAHAQQKTNVLVITNRDGKLLVDGNDQALIKSNETVKLSLEDGDHLIQINASGEIISKTLSCYDGKQKVINFDFSATTAQSVVNKDVDAVTISDIQLDLPGSLGNAQQIRKVYAFDEGDEISFDFNILNKNGTVNISMYSYPDNGLLYSKDKIEEVSGETIKIQKRSIYYFVFSTNHIVNRSAHFVVKRKAASVANKYFKTSVRVKRDTSYSEVLNTQARVYSTNNIGHSNRTIVRINLPAKTTYWVYWIGVGQESMQRMRTLVDQLSKVAAKSLPADPLAAFGLRAISSLPMFNSTATVDYRFADNVNSEIFSRGVPNYNYYTFKEGRNISTDYSISTLAPKEVNLCLWNNNPVTGQDVSIRVVAFIVTSSFVMEEGDNYGNAGK